LGKQVATNFAKNLKNLKAFKITQRTTKQRKHSTKIIADAQIVYFLCFAMHYPVIKFPFFFKSQNK
jgi:hypothetical protein